MTWRERMEAEHGTVYDTDEMGEAFRVVGFSYQMAVAVEKATGARVVLDFEPKVPDPARPRLYWVATRITEG